MKETVMGMCTAVIRNAWRSRILSGYTVLLLGTVGARFISFLTAVLLARQLGPEGFGTYSVFFALFVPFWQATNFLDSTYVRYAKTVSANEGKVYLRGALVLKIGACLLWTAGAYPLAWALAHYAFGKPELTPLLVMAILSGAFLNLLSLDAATYQVEERFTHYAGLNAIFNLCVFVTLGGFLIADLALDPALVSRIYLAAAFLIGTLALFKLYQMARPFQELSKRTLLQILSFSKWLLGANLTYLIFQRLDMLILIRYLEAQSLGQYGAALRIAMAASLFTGAIAPVLLPRAVQTYDSDRALKDYLKEAFRLSLMLVALIGILWVAVPPVVPLLFGAEYAEAVPLARALLVGAVLVAIYTPFSQLFIAEDNPKKMFFLGLIKLGTALAVALTLVPQLGNWGGAAAVVASELAACTFVLAAVGQKVWRHKYKL